MNIKPLLIFLRYAFDAYNMEEKIGVMLPCNVIVFENKSGVVEVATINPNFTMKNVGNEKLSEIADTVNSKLLNVLNKLN